MSNWVKAYIVPGAVFQSVIVGGGYGTGREVVEFISGLGPWGGMAAILLVGLLMGVVMAVSFDLARVYHARDYRVFFKNLIGRFWVSYEIVFILALILVLAITGSAAGSVLEDSFGLPAYMGIGLMLLIVVVLNYYGRQLVEKTLTVWGLLLSAVLIVYAIIVFSQKGNLISANFEYYPVDPDWWKNGVQFFLYNIFLLPVVLYATDHITTRKQAWLSGLIGGVLAVLPGVIFHLTFMAGYPGVLGQSLPTYWMLQQLNLPVLMIVYVVMLFGTIAQTGVGVLQGINERLDHWWLEKKGKRLNQKMHGSIAASTVLMSMLLANVGIVTLVAKGYGSMAWLSLGIFVIPVLTIGVYKLYKN